MSTYIQNYGFTKTFIKKNDRKIKNEIKWIGDYDGTIANIQVDINDNGNKEFMNMKLDNNDLKYLLGVQPVEMPLEQRLYNDFLYNNPKVYEPKVYEPKVYKPIILEGALQKRKTRKHRNSNINKKHRIKRKTYRL